VTRRLWVCSMLLVVLSLVVAACVQATPTPTPYVNACAKIGLPFTPTPRPTRPTPTPTPTVTPGGPGQVEMPPRIDFPSLANVSVPAGAQYLIDVLVSIDIHPPAYYTARSAAHAHGLIVSADGLVLTVLDYSKPMERIEVRVPGMGNYDATVERVDPRTGATLLKIDGVGFPFASLKAGATVELGEPVVVLYLDTAIGELVAREGYGAPAINEGSKDTLFALLSIGSMGHTGSVVVNRDGELLGMVGQWTWWGTGISSPSGPYPGPDGPVVKTVSLLSLLGDEVGEDTISIPAAVAYHSHTREENRGWHIDSPAVRELLAGPVERALQSLGGLADVEKLGQRDRAVLRYKVGTVLELVFAVPQELRLQSGELLGEARYVAFWWGRENGEPNVVLCGAEPGYICGAFLAGDIGELAEAVQAAPRSSRSMVTTDGHLLPGFPSNYPLEWDVEADKAAYRIGEAVNFVVTIRNHSDWPVTAYHLPPAVEVRTRDGYGAWWQQGPGAESLRIAPHETRTFELPWQQVDSEGYGVPPGDYDVSLYWRTARGSRHGAGGRFTILPE